ncbi:hypothetical protein Tco_1434803, partial [Tanacetum coccineum]
ATDLANLKPSVAAADANILDILFVKMDFVSLDCVTCLKVLMTRLTKQVAARLKD